MSRSEYVAVLLSVDEADAIAEMLEQRIESILEQMPTDALASRYAVMQCALDSINETVVSD